MDETFRPRSNFVWAAVAIMLIVLFATNSLLFSENALQNYFELGLCCLLAAATYLIWLRPKLVLRADAIEVTNPLKKETIPYSDVIELETKWALTIIHSQGNTKVWVAPASGKRRWIADKTFGFYGSSVPLTETRTNDSEAMSASLDSLSGQAAYMIRERIKRLH